MNSLAINAVGSELEGAATFCRAQEIGIEITDFAFPENLDADLGPQTERNRTATAGIRPLCSHGPFLDLAAHSLDAAVADVARIRHRAALEASHAVGAPLYIAHTNYNPLIRNRSYRDGFAGRMRDFWLPFADWAAERNLIICLENLWEPDASVQSELVRVAAHPSIQASFDNGHALVFSKSPATEWIRSLGTSLAHCHLHDNDGTHDAHATVGSGKEDWGALLAAAASFAPEAVLVIECDTIEKNTKSLQRIRSLQQGVGG